mgnify:CR=1 FL=1
MTSAFHPPAAGNAPPRVTVLMSVYNGRAFLERSLGSILRQTWRDFEFLIIDNCSTDDGWTFLQARARQDARIRLLRNERNLGLAASLNRGLQEARGEYIARMDADDAARPARLARQVEFMERHADVGICGGQILRHVGAQTHVGRYPLSAEACDVTLLFHACFPHPAVMLRRAALQTGPHFYDARFEQAEDYDLWARMAETVRGCNLPHILLDYYCHPDQGSGTNYPVVAERRNLIRQRVVGKLIPEASPADLALHHQIGFPQDPFDLDMLERSERWLLRLIEANRAVRRYDEPAMRRVFAQRWAMLCGQAAQLGLPVFRRFWASPLRTAAVGPRATAKLLAKCALRKISS